MTTATKEREVSGAASGRVARKKKPAPRCITCLLPRGWLVRHVRYLGIYAEASPDRPAAGEWGAAFKVRLSRRGGEVMCLGCREVQPLLALD